ncbi:hypothetical protein ETAA1_36390 [Urbifossiella limnaea]|uniref:Uncharacterized protein n=1 Tax=Urbifossiella limnaea TaxID=2528023 RepID=A0A517XVX0_9BACT|nr:hypothetical protein ETAA1_36390 [Urbifossiella limnaea]
MRVPSPFWISRAIRFNLPLSVVSSFGVGWSKRRGWVLVFGWMSRSASSIF